MPIRFQGEGNELYPLPPDYLDLSPANQRLARINGVTLQETPTDLVHAWTLFRNYYLRDDEENGFHPGWYKKFKESPPCHYQMIEAIGRYPYNLIGFPRDFAKSTVYMEAAMMLFLTRVNFWVALIYSRLGLVTSRFANMLMYQLTENERILEDFGIVKPGMQKGQWSSSALTNAQTRSTITGHAVKGSLLGARPDLILMDDCEYDDELKVSATELTEHMDRFIHNVVLPMQTKGSASIAILGTLLNQRCWIARWMNVEEVDDVRVKYWNRMVFSAEDKNPDGSLLWEEKFSEEVLAEDKERLGPSAYAAQRLNQPGKHGSGLLVLDKHQGQYTVENEDGMYRVKPLQSKARMVSWKGGQNIALYKMDREFGETVTRMSRLLLVDYAACNSSTSDFVNMLVLGVETSPDYKDMWWILDNYSARIRGEKFFRQMFILGYKWQVKYIGIEAVASQIILPGVAEAYAHLWEGTDWRPRIIPIKYPTGLSKEDRICCLEGRFIQNRIKYPFHLRKKPGVRELYRQTQDFTGEKGCLRYDDAIDTLAMAQYMLGSCKTFEQPTEQPGTCDMMEQLKEGNTHTPEGLWIGAGVSLGEMSMDLIRQLAANYEPNKERTLLWRSIRAKTQM